MKLAPLCLLGLTAVAHASEPRRYAVVVGANEGGSEDGELHWAERDAERVGTVLRQLGGVYEEDLVVLTAPSADRVRRVLTEVGRRAEAAGDGSVLFVYYSGHADAGAMHLAGDELPFSDLVAAIDAVDVAVRVLVVDACKSGSLTRVKGGVPAAPFDIQVPSPARAVGTAIITSSSDTEDSQESERLRGGVFTHHFIAGLLGAADSSGDRQITLQEAYGYGYAETIRTTSQARFVQHPSYAFELRGEDDLVLTRLDGARRTGDLTVDSAGTYVIFDHDADGELVADARLDAGGSLTLPAGAYWLRARGDDGVRQGAVEVPDGGAVAVLRRDLDAVPVGRTIRKGYDDQRPLAAAVAVGAGIAGPSRPGLGAAPALSVGLRVDGAQLSGLFRVRYTGSRVDNSDLTIAEDVVGIDATALRLFDMGPVSPGLGVRAGVDAVQQRFATDGQAPSREALVGRLGSVVRTEFGLGARGALALEGSLDVVAQRAVTGGDVGLTTAVVPGFAVEWTFYAR